MDTETDSLSSHDLSHHETAIVEADHKEIKTFVDHGVFKPVLRAHHKVIDCTWVRKWKRKGDTRIVKSRLC